MWTPVGTGVVWIRIKSDLDVSLFGLFEHDCIDSHQPAAHVDQHEQLADETEPSSEPLLSGTSQD